VAVKALNMAVVFGERGRECLSGPDNTERKVFGQKEKGEDAVTRFVNTNIISRVKAKHEEKVM
jgi:hypothetical protein